jgi:hypothetical protein
VAGDPAQAMDVVDEPVQRRSRRAADVFHVLMVADEADRGPATANENPARCRVTFLSCDAPMHAGSRWRLPDARNPTTRSDEVPVSLSVSSLPHEVADGRDPSSDLVLVDVPEATTIPGCPALGRPGSERSDSSKPSLDTCAGRRCAGGFRSVAPRPGHPITGLRLIGGGLERQVEVRRHLVRGYELFEG